MGERRNLALSYVLWALGLVGVCGVHRFYNRKPSAALSGCSLLASASWANWLISG